MSLSTIRSEICFAIRFSLLQPVHSAEDVNRWFQCVDKYLRNEIRRGVLLLEVESHAGPRTVRRHDSLNRVAEAVKEHPLDADMVVEEFHVNGAGYGAAHMHMHAGAAVR